MPPSICPYCQSDLGMWSHEHNGQVTCTRCTRVVGSYIRCASCGGKNWVASDRTGAAVCGQCKRQLGNDGERYSQPEVSTARKSPHDDTKSAFKRCPQCNARSDLDARFCAKCGYRYPPVAENVHVHSDPPPGDSTASRGYSLLDAWSDAYAEFGGDQRPKTTPPLPSQNDGMGCFGPCCTWSLAILLIMVTGLLLIMNYGPRDFLR